MKTTVHTLAELRDELNKLADRRDIGLHVPWHVLFENPIEIRIVETSPYLIQLSSPVQKIVVR